MRRNRPRTGAGISRFERPAVLPPPAGSRPVPAAPTAGREVPVPQGPSLFRVPSGGIFAPARDVKAAAFPRPLNFTAPLKDLPGRCTRPRYRTAEFLFLQASRLKARVQSEHHGRQRMRDGVHRGMPARARTHQVDGIRRTPSDPRKRYGAALQGSGSKTVLPRGKDVHSQYGLQQPSSHSSGFRGAGTGTPHCARSAPAGLRVAAAGSAFCFRAGRRRPRGISGNRRQGRLIFPPAAFRHAFLAAVCIGYQRFCAAWAAACCKARICCA